MIASLGMSLSCSTCAFTYKRITSGKLLSAMHSGVKYNLSEVVFHFKKVF